MVTKIKNYIGFFAAIFSIVSSILYFDATRNWWDKDNVNDALATWFLAGSLVLWVVFVIIHVILWTTATKNKKR